MLSRFFALFDRYARTHLDAVTDGPDLMDGQGRRIGHVDRIRVRGNRLHVEGWSLAPLVSLRAGAAEISVRPALLRQDVGDALGVDPAVGFTLEIPADPAGAQLSAGLPGTGARSETPLPLPAVARARRRLWLRFLRDLARAAPAMLRWRLTHDPRHRATVKAILGMRSVSHAGPMESRLFERPGEVPPAPPVTGLTIILPVYNAFDLLPEVLDRVRRHTDLPWHLIVIEDMSSDDRVRPFLRDWVAELTGVNNPAATPAPYGTVELIENARNLGFIGSVNAGLARALTLGHHVVLLNSDAFVPAGWASRLLRPILMHENVATVTPMSNDAEICSVPVICRRQVLEPGMGDAIDAIARRFNPEATLSVAPTGVGFCMAMNVAFLRRLPRLDPVFGRGYGEEVDWCQKARALGGRHLGLPGLFVEHRGGESFGSEAKRKLVARNNAFIAERYPAYDSEVQDFIAADPLLTGRVTLALAWVGAWSDCHDGTPIPIYLAHSLGGGAEKYLERRMAEDLAANGRPSIVLRVGGAMRWRVEIVSANGVVAGMTDDFAFVTRILAAIPRREILYSCGVGDSDPVGLPDHLLSLRHSPDDRIEILFHDFFPLSPSYTLLDSDGVYRGPLLPGRDATPGGRAHSLPRPDGGEITLSGWQEAWGRLIAAADRVTVFSEDSRVQVLSVYPEATERLVVQPHRLLAEVPRIAPQSPSPSAQSDQSGPSDQSGRPVIGVLGNIGYQKGAAVLQDLAGRLGTGQYDGKPAPALVLIGNIDPAYALPDSVPIHGDYAIADIPGLVARYGITHWLIPSIWPETFSYTTREALATGLPVLAFHIGAQGEAVAQAENGIAVHFTPGGDLAGNILHDMMAQLEMDPVKESS